jgi:flagellar biosynthesis/type III secretory pathway chaperone
MQTYIDAKLIRDLEDYLDHERSALLQWRDAVNTMRTKLLAGAVTESLHCLPLDPQQRKRQRHTRAELLIRLAERLKISDTEVCLSAVEAHVDSATRDRLKRKRQFLQQLLRGIRTTTNANAALVLQASEVIKQLVESLSQTRFPCTTYDAAGKLQDGSIKGLRQHSQS